MTRAWLTLVLVACSAAAQDSRGVLLGHVTDSTGAAVAGAQVHAVNIATNAGASSVTNAEGNYTLPYLLPGGYSVTVSSSGFKKAVRNGLELHVDDQLTVDVVLEVGDVSDSISVTASAPLLETATASVGMVVDERRVTELPVMGGNAFGLVRLAPGMAATGGHAANNPMDYGAASSGAVNGTRSGSTEVSLDGSPNMFRSNTAYAPPSDMVQEFKVQTVTYDAALGHAPGAAVNVSMKSGANRLHGTSYFFDSWIRATPWFANKWLYDTSTGPITSEKRAQANPAWLHQRWGDTASGPIVIPKLYDGRNRTFWSAGYEGMYIRRAATFTGTVPTADERRGDFTSLLKIGAQYQIYDPLTTAVSATPGRFARKPLPGNVIPLSRLNPVGMNIVSYWPAANVPGSIDGRNNYFRIADENKDYKSFVGRVDHNISERHRFFVRANESVYDDHLQNLKTIASGDITHQPSWGAALDDVYVFGPQLLLNVRYGFTLMNPNVSRFSSGMDLTTLGLPQALVNEIQTRGNPAGVAFPQVQVDGSAFTDLSTGGGNARVTNYHTAGGTLTRLAGNHSLRAGGEFRLLRDTGFAYNNAAPQLVFANTYTRGPVDNSPGAPIGQGLAALLLGIPTGGQVSVNSSRAEQSTFTALFLQDDWRITRKLTLNAGLRYEFEGAPTERYNRSLRGFDFTADSPIAAQALANYAKAPLPELPASAFHTRGGLTFPGVNGQPRSLWSTDRNNIAPRIGLAFHVTPKMVLRSGYGIFYDVVGVDQLDVNQGGFNQNTPLLPTKDNGLTFTSTLSNPFPDGIQTPPGAAGGLRTFLGRAVTFFNEQPRNAYMQRWSFSVQRELPWRTVFEAGYVGNRGTHLSITRQLDPTPRQYLSTLPVRDQQTIDFLSAQVANPFNGIADFAGVGLGNLKTSHGQLLRPYPQFTGIAVDLPLGFSWYHSLQIQAEKRMSHGFTFQSNYTWSKFMEATTYLNETDPVTAHTISDQDFPHRFTISTIYELPFFGKRALLGGWQLQGFYEGQSGQALAWGNIIFDGGIHTIPVSSDHRSVERWFNVDAGFERNSQLQLASNIRTFPERLSGVRGDGIQNIDMSLFKTFRLTERFRAQFRMEAYNALNHVEFANPNTNPVSSTFGQVTAEKGHGQRQMTFAVKVLF